MKVTLKLLKDYGDFKAGKLVEVAEENVQTMIDEGNAEKYVPQITVEKATEQAEEMLKGALEKVATELKLPKVEMIEDEKDKPVWSSGGEFYNSVKRHATGDTTEKMSAYMEKAPSGQNTIMDSEGGFLVPVESSMQLMTSLDENAVIAPRCQPLPINNRIELPYIRDFDKSASWAGGVQVAWGKEAGTLSESSAEFGQVELKLNKLHAYVPATDEMLSDSAVSMEQIINMLAGIALAKEVDHQIVNGIGAGRPRGIISDQAVISIAKTSGQAAGTFTFVNALKMWSAISNRDKAVWLMNRQVEEQYWQMNQIVGTGGSSVIVTNGRERLPATLLGAPIIVTEHAQLAGTVGDVILTDLSQYLFATKAGGPEVKTATSIHVKFVTDQVVFRFTKRVDGQGWWKSAQTQKDGTTQISPFVTLAARS